MNNKRKFSRDVAAQILYQLGLREESDYAELLSRYKEICADGTYEEIHRSFMLDFPKKVEIPTKVSDDYWDKIEKAKNLEQEEHASNVARMKAKTNNLSMRVPLQKTMKLENKYMDRVLGAFVEHRECIDRHIEDNLVKWSFDRIAAMDLAILRLALAEILYLDDIPYKSSVNEAVELAKQYGDEKSSSFINGLLANFSGE